MPFDRRDRCRPWRNLSRAALMMVVSLGLTACSSSTAPALEARLVDGSTDSDRPRPLEGAADQSKPVPLPPLPLRASSRWILDASGQRLKLVSVNWYGAESPDHVVAGLDRSQLADIARLIRKLGFNSVRLPWSNELVEKDPVVDAGRLKANPSLVGLHALDVLDRVIAALAYEGLLVILDNHVSRADWCCDDKDGNGLWYTADYPESSWIADWKTMAGRYAGVPAVVGADLRNELRPAGGKSPVWGGGDPATDWAAAAERVGNAILARNPSLLIIVEGLAYSTDLRGVYSRPVVLSKPGRLVYSPHDYSWFHDGLNSYSQLKTNLGDNWGYILAQGKSYTAPVWVSEFGTCHDQPSCVSDVSGQGFWFLGIRKYLAEADIDWAYWALNGTQASGTGRTLGAEEGYGILDSGWSAAASQELLMALQLLQPITQRP